MEKKECAVEECENEGTVPLEVGRANSDEKVKLFICSSCWEKLNFDRQPLKFKESLK